MDFPLIETGQIGQDLADQGRLLELFAEPLTSDPQVPPRSPWMGKHLHLYFH